MTLEELLEILKLDKPSEEIRKRETVIFELIPELENCKGFDQHSEWHPYDVYEHTLQVVDNIENDEVLRMSALFHDLGKPDTFEEDKYGIGHFPNHWFISKEIFEKFSNETGYSKDKTKLISKLITYHDLNLGIMDKEITEQLLGTFNSEELTLLYKLKKADLLAQNSEYHYLLKEYDKQENVYKLLYKKEEL